MPVNPREIRELLGPMVPLDPERPWMDADTAAALEEGRRAKMAWEVKKKAQEVQERVYIRGGVSITVAEAQALAAAERESDEWKARLQERDRLTEQSRLRRKYGSLDADELLALSSEDWEEWTSIATEEELQPVTWQACQERAAARARERLLGGVAHGLILVSIGGAACGLAFAAAGIPALLSFLKTAFFVSLVWTSLFWLIDGSPPWSWWR